MKARYPIFLSKNPSFLGLELMDLFLIGIGLIFSLTFRLSSFTGFFTTGALIVIRIIAAKFFDLKGVLYGPTSRKSVSVYWQELVLKERK